MKRVLILLHIILCTCIVTQAKNYTVSSPDGKIKVTVTAGKQLSWSINYNGERILNPSLMQMDIEGQTEQPGVNPKVIKAKTLKVNSEQTAVIPLKQRIIKDQYNQLTLTCKGNYAIVFRVYNNGAAYRFETSLKQPKVIINTETIEQNWTEGCKLYWPREKNQEYLTHCEAIFDELNISSLTKDMKGYLPIYLSTPKGTKVVIISSHQNYEYFRSAIQLNVADFLLKPIKSADIIACFERIKQELDERNHIEPEQNKSYYEKILDEVKKYIEDNFQEASLEAAAIRVNLSASYLSRILKEKCDFGFAEYLVKIRMEKAAEMLMDSHYKSYDIAYYVGYDNPKSFSQRVLWDDSDGL
jgi:AraC-like DNA-binding protein